MDLINHTGTAIAVFIGIGLLSGNVWYAIKSKSNKVLREDMADLNQKLDACETKHVANETRIHELEQKVQNTVNIPLEKIAEHMKKSNEIQQKSNEILARLGEKI